MRSLKKLTPIFLAAALVGCHSQTSAPPANAHHASSSVDRGSKTSIAGSSKPGSSVDRKSGTGGLCMPCVGPHLNLMNGKISFISMGPGINF